ncbi:E3 ubiquitin-protein ligase At1g63170-like [Vicia villosa]|uniref:E3 ubiquitin-protein ligase At1g63170-like n=1 Tax=Vicia villosa TaxID=3911 RepID=UPI00273BABF7|nr:E3 ubiquitin-protein ligase At1g63170-like [Vicia villosa]
MVSFSSNYAIGENSIMASTSTSIQNMSQQTTLSQSQPSFMTRMAMRISRSRWFTFLRRVFHYQNGPRSDLGSNPFNSRTWMMLELVALLVQITSTTFTLVVSKSEKPVRPMRVWVVGYDVGCVLSLLLLCVRYCQIGLSHGGEDDALGVSYDVEQQSNNEENSVYRSTHLMSKCRSSLELFFAIWFVMGNVWSFDSRFGTLQQAPKLQILCIILLVWNAICYSFPFLLFLLLCCCVPLITILLGYDMNMGSSSRGASEDQISQLPSWRFKVGHTKLDLDNGSQCSERLIRDEPECCICLAKYKDKEEVRQLPCSHMFHLKCVDQWLKIISCCPLCKQELR